jgi:hypothetical protein
VSDDLSGVVRAGVPTVDDCPVLTRMRAFIVDQGVEATLEHVILNRAGNPVNLTPLFGGADSSISDSEPTGTIVLRVKEALGRGANPERNPIWEVTGSCLTPESGVVRADLDEKIVAKSGVYQLSWGVQNLDGKTVLVNNSILSVERSLFASVGEIEKDAGPLTIQALRVYLRDSHPNENMRLDNVEFGDEEILNAILRPVEYYNEQPPPIGRFTTRNFPSRYQWSQAAISVLYEMAAHWYRRNKQQIQAGGMADDDLNRDQGYDGKSQALWADFKDWVIRDKVMRNSRLVAGSIGSVYGGRFGDRW